MVKARKGTGWREISHIGLLFIKENTITRPGCSGVGFLIHTYAGRDYLNIRFDDIVFIGQLGLYMRINKK